ncbi:MAG TPA: DOMON-like domain-containing protein [Pseudolabrys sp.]|nr:DOMON-like domain-containing protein [Pseudolabrys sp.]
MRQSLRLHPDSQGSAVTGIEVEVVCPRADSLILSYTVIGKISEVRMATGVRSARSDELWRHTCFEAFVRASSEAGYYEFNFAPSTQWAAYQFTGYRSGMRVAAEISAPLIEVRSSPDCYVLQASLELERLLSLPRKALWDLGLSALIEDKNGHKSYWALAHPPGKPDFHHADCFAYKFSPVVQP